MREEKQMQKEKNIMELSQTVPKLSLVKKLSTPDGCVPPYPTVTCLQVLAQEQQHNCSSKMHVNLKAGFFIAPPPPTWTCPSPQQAVKRLWYTQKVQYGVTRKKTASPQHQLQRQLWEPSWGKAHSWPFTQTADISKCQVPEGRRQTGLCSGAYSKIIP